MCYLSLEMIPGIVCNMRGEFFLVIEQLELPFVNTEQCIFYCL